MRGVIVSPSFVVYIDESGDEGFRFDKGSSEWMVLSATVFRQEEERQEVRLVREICDLFGRDASKGLHFTNLRHPQRVAYVDRISKARVRCSSIAVRKPSLNEPEVFQAAKRRLYIYTVRYLVERVSWFCREMRKRDDPGDGTADITFSHRRGMSYEGIRSYLEGLKALRTEIHWPAIAIERIRALPHKQRMGLQIADAVASSVFQALERNPFGHTEDRYVRILKPVIWRRKGKWRGYGLKIWPKEAEPALDWDGQHAWLKDFWEEK